MEYGIAAGSSQTDMPYFEASGTGRGKHTQYQYSGLCVLKLEPTCRRFMKLHKTQLPLRQSASPLVWTSWITRTAEPGELLLGLDD